MNGLNRIMEMTCERNTEFDDGLKKFVQPEKQQDRIQKNYKEHQEPVGNNKTF